MAAGEIKVRGLRDMQAAFKAADRKLVRDLRSRLRQAVEPVRADAEQLAPARIKNVQPGDAWSRMRTGVTTTTVYVAPVQRGVYRRGDQKLRRPRFGDKLLARAMEPALEGRSGEITRAVEKVLDEVGDAWSRE